MTEIRHARPSRPSADRPECRRGRRTVGSGSRRTALFHDSRRFSHFRHRHLPASLCGEASCSDRKRRTGGIRRAVQRPLDNGAVPGVPSRATRRLPAHARRGPPPGADAFRLLKAERAGRTRQSTKCAPAVDGRSALRKAKDAYQSFSGYSPAAISSRIFSTTPGRSAA